MKRKLRMRSLGQFVWWNSTARSKEKKEKNKEMGEKKRKKTRMRSLGQFVGVEINS